MNEREKPPVTKGHQAGCDYAAGSAISGPNLKLLEWVIEQIGIKTLTKLQKRCPRDCQDISQKTVETGKI
jgi:hypothetical protein